MGGYHLVSCNFYTQLILHWAQERNVWLSAAYIPGKDNVEADFHSRCFTEWTLDCAVFRSICHIYFLPLIDLFASCHNKRLDNYILPITYHLSPITYHLPHITCYILRITYYILRITYYLLRITYYLLPITHYLLPITYYLLPIT